MSESTAPPQKRAAVAANRGPLNAGRRRYRCYPEFVATRTRAEGIEELRAKILESVQGLVGKGVDVEVGWLPDSIDEEEILVQVTLADPGENTWDQGVTNAIRTAVRAATAEVMPSVVATTRLVSSEDDG